MRSGDARTTPAGLLVLVLAFAGITVSLMQTLMVPLVPMLPRLLSASPADTPWAVTAPLLASASATPIMGRLGDMYGKKRMLLTSLSFLVAGSVVVALSSTLFLMIVGRVLQGMAAGVIPLGISIMRDVLPGDKLGSAMAMMSASLGVGGALGLPLGAFLVERTDWHMLFWVAGGLGVLSFALIGVLVPESLVRTGGRFDLLGAVGLAAGLLCVLLAVSKGGDWGWGSYTTTGLFAAGGVILVLWGCWESRTHQPLVDLRTTVRRQVLLTNIASVVFGFAMLVMSLVMPQLLQQPTSTGYGMGQSLLTVGLVMAPSGLVMMSMSPVSARISKAKGPKTTLMVGAVVVAAGYTLGIFMMSHIWQLIVVTALVGGGIGLAYGAMPALVMAAVPVSETAAANSLNTLMRAIGTSTASAVAGVILAQMTVSYGNIFAPKPEAFQLVMAIAAAAAVAALGIAAFLPSRQPSGAATSVPQPPAPVRVGAK